MPTHDCDHQGHRVYARRVFRNGTTHYCLQCLLCLTTVKAEEHGNRPWIRHDEIPAGMPVYSFIDPEARI